MKKLSGMKKLRLGVTVVFLLLVLSIAIGVYIAAVDTEADEVFYERLTDDDINDLNRIFGKYPLTNTENILPIAGYLTWIAILGISYLMFKVWNAKEIK